MTNCIKIYLHGLGYDTSFWDDIATDEAIRPSLSEFLVYPSYESVYVAFSDYADALAVDGGLILHGQGLGALLMLNYAADKPDKVLSLQTTQPIYRVSWLYSWGLRAFIAFIPRGIVFKELGMTKKEVSMLIKSMAGLDFRRLRG